MTTPGGSAPNGAYVVGDSFGSDVTEDSARAMTTGGAKSAFGNAQDAFKSEFISAELVNGEVVRLDNRIDEILIGTERAFLYTFSESGVWDKHPAAYKVVVDVLSGASGGGSGDGAAAGNGGYSGGWERATYSGTALEDLPNSVSVTVGAGTPGNSTATAGSSSFGSFLSTAGATPSNYGSGSRTYKMRGGRGGYNSTGTDGSAGPFATGGSGGAWYQSAANGGPGGHGFSIDAGQIGTGSAGGGGGSGSGAFWVGGNGGFGGWPSAPGGGGGAGAGGASTGGNGAAGAVFVTVYVADELGVPPSTPTNLSASSITKSSARVSWTASIDDVMVKQYVLFLNGVRYGVVNTTYHDFVGLNASTAYEVRVQAVDIGENASALSDPLTFTTLAS
ncbi:fibronectin type III domain-containing protein [Rhodococcus ruber]|uniref:fibronectin type III domain-containing protein n=1 Tax=Rhodococcus ruber TaxID=1830 RepID=UPI0037837FEC